MTCKNLFLFTILCICTLISEAPTTAQGKKQTYKVSAFTIYQSLPVNHTVQGKCRKLVNTEFPGWHVSADKLNGLFTDIYGTPVTLQGGTSTEKAENCIRHQLKQLGVIEGEWKKVSNTEAPKADYVYYTQIIKGHPVVFTSLNFRFTKDGALARITMKNFGEPANNVTPSLTAEQAKSIALQDLSDLTIKSNEISNEWSWFPVPNTTGYELRPSWSFTVAASKTGSVPVRLTGYIDAINGKMLYRTNTIKETSYDVTVKGVVYKNGTLNPATAEALPYLDLNIGSSTYFTDTAGHCAPIGVSLPQSTNIPLKGKWSTVIDMASHGTPAFTDVVSVPGTTYAYPTTSPSSDRHVNAYYHVNRIHDFMKGYFPAFTGMDTSLVTNVDVSFGTCNAYYSGSDINFFAAGGGCNSFAELGDVVYHEYGHGISDHFYQSVTGSTIMNSSLNEACSDIWALSITHNPIMAQNAYTTFGGFGRRYDMMPQVYPIDVDYTGFADPHKIGQIIAGTWWDVGVNIGSPDSMTKLFTDVYFDVPDGPDGTEGTVFQSILIDALMADDNNSNLMDGTPHYSQIVAAFAKHGLYLEQDADITPTELPIQTAGVPIPLSFNLSLMNSDFFHDLTIYYRINGAGTWNPVTLTNSSFHFTGTIPAQPAGTVVEYYFIIHDSLNVANAYFPITCNNSLPAYETTIPYQFGVGLQRSIRDSFESTLNPGWAIGSNPGDDATRGTWILDYPGTTGTGTYPFGDHTTGLGQCLTTGNGVIDTGIFGGTTTVLTPVFDISGFTNPVIEYYRWFSNEAGYENFKKDPWVVKIRDASNNIWKTVESTYQADDNWRRRIFRVSAFLPAGTAKIQLKFFASDSMFSNWVDYGQGINAGAIDDFTVYDSKVHGVSVAGTTPPTTEVFPNPANREIDIKLATGNTGFIWLYDMTGRQIEKIVIEPQNGNYSFNTKGLVSGNYNVVIQANEIILCRKIVVESN